MKEVMDKPLDEHRVTKYGVVTESTMDTSLASHEKRHHSNDAGSVKVMNPNELEPGNY